MSFLTSKALLAPVIPIQRAHEISPNKRKDPTRLRTHGSTESSVDLENGQLIEKVGILSGWQGRIRNDLVFVGGADFVPFPMTATMRWTSGLRLIAQISWGEVTHSPLA